MNYTVVVKEDYSTIKFEFDKPGQAMDFARTAYLKHKDAYDHNKEVKELSVTIEVSREEF